MTNSILSKKFIIFLVEVPSFHDKLLSIKIISRISKKLKNLNLAVSISDSRTKNCIFDSRANQVQYSVASRLTPILQNDIIWPCYLVRDCGKSKFKRRFVEKNIYTE